MHSSVHTYVRAIVGMLAGVLCCMMPVQAWPSINYGLPLPGAGVLQSKDNGWTTPASGQFKDIITPEVVPEYAGSTTPPWCKRIRAGAITVMYFIPTKTLPEWNSFKQFTPPGISISNCPVDAICGSTGNTCQAGTPVNFSAPECGGTQTWTCQGLYGGTSVSCSAANVWCPRCNSSYKNPPYTRSCTHGTREGYTQLSCGDKETWTCRWGRTNSATVQCRAENPSCRWDVGTWGSCRETSPNNWNETRTVSCFDPYRNMTAPDSSCPTHKPRTQQSCCHPHEGYVCRVANTTWTFPSPLSDQSVWCTVDIQGNRWEDYRVVGTPPCSWGLCDVTCRAWPARGVIQCDGSCQAYPIWPAWPWPLRWR